MDMIVDRLSAIEQSACRIIDSAAEEKKRLEEQARAQTAAYDAAIDRETEEKRRALQKQLQLRMEEALLELTHDTEKAIHRMEQDYDANHEALANQILQKLTKG